MPPPTDARSEVPPSSEEVPALIPAAGGPGLCDRCGGRVGRGGVRVEVRASGEDEAGETLTIQTCKECGRSLSRWLERGGRTHAQVVRKSKAPEPRKRTRRRGRFRPSRHQTAFVAVVVFCLLFCFYFLRGSSAE